MVALSAVVCFVNTFPGKNFITYIEKHFIYLITPKKTTDRQQYREENGVQVWLEAQGLTVYENHTTQKKLYKVHKYKNKKGLLKHIIENTNYFVFNKENVMYVCMFVCES